MPWNFQLSRPAQKALRSAPKVDRERISKALEAMAENPLGGDTKMLRGSGGTLRRRVGRWRILFSLEEDIIHVKHVLRRTTTTYKK